MSEVDHRISPSLHPDTVTKIDGYDADTEAVLAPTVTAFSTAYEGLRQIHDTRAVVHQNPGWTDEQKLLQVDTFAKKHFERMTRAFDSVLVSLNKGIAHLEGELSQPVTTKAAGSIAGEVRAHVKALPTEQRMSVIQKAIVESDHEVATAVLGAPAMLSGIEGGMQKVLLRQYHEKNNPAATKRLKAMQGAKELVEQRAGLIFKEVERAVGGTSAAANKVRKAQDAAEKALAFKEA